MIAPHPLPPADFADRELALLRYSRVVVRVHRSSRDPIYYGKSGASRFDAPEGEYGVLYAGEDEACAFIETFGQATGLRLIDEAELAQRSWSFLHVTSAELVDLTGEGLARLGADNRLCDGDHALAQAWSRALHAHPSRPDGIRFRARHDPERVSVAIFDRAHKRVKRWKTESLELERVAPLLERYQFGIT